MKTPQLPRFNPTIQPKEDPVLARAYIKHREQFMWRANRNQRIGDLLLGGFTVMVFAIVAHMVAGR